MPSLRVLHAVYSWLPVTQNWIYTQLRCNKEFEPAVISMTEEENGQFPVNERYTAFRRRFTDRIGLLAARYWLRQPGAFYRKIVPSLSPALIHGHFSTESWRVLPYARSCGIPLVTTFYGLDVDKLPRRRYWKQRYPHLFSYGSRFLVEGPFMGRRLEATGCPAGKITVVALGVDRSLYGDGASPYRSDEGGPVKVLFTGLEREKKGARDAAAVFIAAAREASRLELHIIGNGGYRRPVERMLQQAGMLGRTTFYGYIPFKRYREVLAGCDILLAPSRYAADGDCEGGAPVVCIEAQASGLPVVGTKHCDIPFVVEHGKTGLLSGEGDRTSLTRDLLRLANDAPLRRHFGEQGRKLVARQHDIDIQVGKIAGIYREVIEESKAGNADE